MKKTTKATLTAALGVTLLLGGSTYALWTANTAPLTSAEIEIGGADLEVSDQGKWIDVIASQSEPESPEVVIDNITDFRTVPGDKLAFKQVFAVNSSGQTGDFLLSVAMPNDSIDLADLRSKGIDLSLQIVDSETKSVLAQSSNDLEASYALNMNESPSKSFEVNFIFDFKNTANLEETKNLQTIIQKANVIVKQV